MATTAMTNMIAGAQAVISYNFNHPLILWEALQAAGSPVHSINGRRLLDGNKRLAIVGDRVLELALAEGWYEGTEARGRFNQIRTEVGANAHLSGVCQSTGLAAFINKNQASWGAVAPATGSATVEAVLAAVFLDSGSMDAVKQVMDTLGLVPE